MALFNKRPDAEPVLSHEELKAQFLDFLEKNYPDVIIIPDAGDYDLLLIKPITVETRQTSPGINPQTQTVSRHLWELYGVFLSIHMISNSFLPLSQEFVGTSLKSFKYFLSKQGIEPT